MDARLNERITTVFSAAKNVVGQSRVAQGAIENWRHVKLDWPWDASTRTQREAVTKFGNAFLDFADVYDFENDAFFEAVYAGNGNRPARILQQIGFSVLEITYEFLSNIYGWMTHYENIGDDAPLSFDVLPIDQRRLLDAWPQVCGYLSSALTFDTNELLVELECERRRAVSALQVRAKQPPPQPANIDIPPDRQTRPLSCNEAAKYLPAFNGEGGRKILANAIAAGAVKCMPIPGTIKRVFDIDAFPQANRDKVRPKLGEVG